MRSLVEIVSGSHAYGTTVPGSDLDLKFVHIPDAADIVMQRARTAERVPVEDGESFALHKFLAMAAEGQPLALEMLLAPPDLVRCDGPEWRALVAGRERLMPARTKFTSYARGQAARYLAASGNYAPLRRLVGLLEEAINTHGSDARAEPAFDAISSTMGEAGPRRFERMDSGRAVPYIELGGRQALLTASLATVHGIFAASLASYGARAERASEQGVDWKSLMHALRIATEGEEYHRTSAISFPHPDAEHLRAVRLGRVPLDEVRGELVAALSRCQEAEATSMRPEGVDQDWIDSILLDAYGMEVAATFHAAPAQGRVP